MRDLTQIEREILNKKNYVPYSNVKVASNGREYILVKNNNGKKLGARFLSTLNKNVENKSLNVKKVRIIDSKSIDKNIEEKSLNVKIADNKSINELNNDSKELIEEKEINKLSEITELHNTILKLQKDIERLEQNHRDKQEISTKKIELDTISVKFDKEMEKNKEILPDKNTIMDIINDILI